MLSAGKLDRRLKLLRLSVAEGRFNEDDEEWTLLAEVWASKEDVKDGERMAAQAVSASVTSRFRVRWSFDTSSLTTRDRVQLGDRQYAITAIKELGRREGLEITAAAMADGPIP